MAAQILYLGYDSSMIFKSPDIVGTWYLKKILPSNTGNKSENFRKNLSKYKTL